MAQVITPANIILGAGQVYYRALGVLTAWTGIGATMDDMTMRIAQAWFRPDLNGMLGPIQEMDYLTEQSAEIEFTMVEVAGASKLALAIPGATSTTSATTAAGTPLATTLATAASIGDTDIYVAGVTNAAVGDYVLINVAGALAEYRQLTRVGTAGASGTGTGLGFRDPLQKNHNSGVAVGEVVGDGKVSITGSTVRRMPASAYNQWALVGEAPAGYYELLLTSGISTTDSAEVTFGDETVGGIRTTIASRYAGATPNTPPWTLRVPA